MTSITPKDLKAQIDETGPIRLLDVREPEEHAHCALPDSRLLPLSELEARWQELEEWCAADGGTVVYCHHGVRARTQSRFWRKRGLPVW